MCGIAGIASARTRHADCDPLPAMAAALVHRGPDDGGFFQDDGVGLAHRRLSIVDLAGGHQPMANEDGSVRVAFNGEIFNFPELRAEQIARGHRFSTRSDTEVILHAYEDEGEACVRRFNGQWAFALWDARSSTLLLSRDRLGVRPLYYTVADGTLLFASEIKALLAHPLVAREIDPLGLDELLTFWTTLPPRTMFKGICELPPGHSLTWRNGVARMTRYWAPAYDPGLLEGRDEADLAAELDRLLTTAVRIRLRSDVPVGAFLSGGLDSSVIAALLRRSTDAGLHTFSIAFDDKEYDESRYQREMAARLGSEHHELRCSNEQIAAVLPDVVWHAEKPLLRTAPAPMYLLCRLTRECGFKVVLTGEGADEVLGGYDIFKEAKIRRFWAASGSSRRAQLLRRLYPYLADLRRQPAAYLERFFRATREDLASPFFSHLPRWSTTSRIKQFLSRDMVEAAAGRDVIADLAATLPIDFGRWEPFCQAQYLETAHLLPGYILSSQGDRMAMAHAIEGRFPFLDPDVVEFASRLPVRAKMRVLDEKHLLKVMARDLVPESIRSRPKQPYRAPEGRALIDGDRQGYLRDLLSSSIRSGGR